MLNGQTLTDHLRETQRFTRRTLAISLWMLFFTFLLVGRLVYLQLYQHHLYTTLSQQNQLAVVPIKPNRGLIYDRNGILIADNIPVYSLEITPSHVTNLNKTIAQLRQIIAITDEDIETFTKQIKQHRPTDSVPLRVKLSEEEIARFSVDQHRFPGVEVNARLIRHYPFGEKLAHVLGFVGRINERELQQVDTVNYRATLFMGKVGIEKYYEKQLHGDIGYQQIETDARGRTVRVLERTPPKTGNNLTLSIDSQLTIAAMKALGKHRGAVVVINPNNGELLALVSNPSYDPNLFVQGISHAAYQTLSTSDQQPLFNRAIRGQYPLGSTIKPFLGLAALDNNIVTPSYKIWDPGWFRLPNSSHLYRDWARGRGGHGWINLKQALIVSCDPYFYHLGVLMGITGIDSILTKFGFGILTGVDMGGELAGLVPSPAWKLRHKGASWYPGDTVISAIGQGFMLTTPLQLAAATAALATHGVRHHPHLLLHQVLADNSAQLFTPEHRFPVKIKHAYVWNFIIDAMRKVITKGDGTGFRFGRHAPYSVAAKTGTSQLFSIKQDTVVNNEDIPLRLRDHSLFIGFAPIKKPQIAVAVIVENAPFAPNVTRRVMDAYFANKHTPKQTAGARTS